MRRDDVDDDSPYVIIEDRSSDIGPFIVGALLGAGLALLFAPHSGPETRAALKGRLRNAGARARGAAGSVAGRVSGTFAEAREEIERRIESARAAVSERSQQLTDAVAAGRTAARDARTELRARLADSRTRRTGPPVPPPGAHGPESSRGGTTPTPSTAAGGESGSPEG